MVLIDYMYSKYREIAVTPIWHGNLPLWYVVHGIGWGLVQSTLVDWPQATEDAEERAFATAIWTSDQQMHTRLHLVKIHKKTNQSFKLHLNANTSHSHTSHCKCIDSQIIKSNAESISLRLTSTKKHATCPGSPSNAQSHHI